MKKTLVAIAVLASASTVALAASQVTLYGKIDQSVTVSQTRHDDTIAALQSGFNAGSRWGIKGNEDLGNGYSVGFVLEHGFNADTGNSSSSRAFHRQSTMQVAGGFGTVAVGRMGALSSGTGSYTLVSAANLDPMDACYTQIGAFNSGAFVDVGRADNTIAYVSPDFAGFKVAAAYSNNIDGSSTDDNAQKWSKNNHYYGIGATYNAGPLGAVAIFEMIDTRRATEGGVAGLPENKKAYIATIGASYDFNVIRPYFGYQFAAQTDYRSQNAFLLGLTSPIGGGVAKLSAKYMFGEFKGESKALTEATLGEKDYSVFQIAAAYEYPISKRTKVYGFGGYAHGYDAASADNMQKVAALNSDQVSSVKGALGAWRLRT